MSAPTHFEPLTYRQHVALEMAVYDSFDRNLTDFDHHSTVPPNKYTAGRLKSLAHRLWQLDSAQRVLRSSVLEVVPEPQAKVWDG